VTDPKLFFEAIALKKCVSARYNKLAVILAPHILYTKHGELHIDAVTIEREGLPPREAKVGTFKLTGLSEVELTERAFAPDPVFEPAAERYENVALFVVEP
jgi:hypothetical protein